MSHTIDAVSLLTTVAWYHISDPNSAALDELARRFSLHPLQIEDCRHRPQRAKIEETPEYLFFVLKHIHTAAFERSTVARPSAFDDIDVFVGRDFIITVSQGDLPLLDRVRNRAAQDVFSRPDRVFYMLIDEVVDGYLAVLDSVAEETSSIETEILERAEPAMLRRIFRLKRRLIMFRRIAGEMRELVNTIIRREQGLIGDDLDVYFRDVYDHLIRTADFIESYRDLLTGSLDIYLSVMANRTNEVMKVLTIYGTISIPLVVITGFFGMNLPLPWQHTPHGTLFAILTMLISTALVLLYFKRKHWF